MERKWVGNIWRWSLGLAAWICLEACPCQAIQESTGAPSAAADGLAQAEKEFQSAIEEWRRITRVAVDARLAYENGSREESETHREAWDSAILEGERQRTVVEQCALRLMNLTDRPGQDLIELLNQIHASAMIRGRWHKAEEIAVVLRKVKADDEGFLARDAMAAVSMNRFDEALAFLEGYGSMIPSMPAKQQDLFGQLPELMEKYAREKQFLAKDAEGEPLPRVALKTTKGRIELELFEDQAPDTVANFIYLVEAGFYTNLLFHRVINDFMAQAGGYGLDKLGREPPYSIFDEHNSPDARHHFQAYLSMANAGVPDSGSAQFFILFCPAPSLDGKHTVFGRVVAGFDVFESLNRTHVPNDQGEEEEITDVVPDHIISASVIRKRNHEYKPRKVQ